MELHQGRLIDHIHLRARDFPVTAKFYRSVLGALGIPLLADDDWHLACDELWIDALGKDQGAATHVHLAFQAKDHDAVRLFHQAQGLPPVAGTMEGRESGPTISAITRPSCSIRTATISKRSITVRRAARRPRW